METTLVLLAESAIQCIKISLHSRCLYLFRERVLWPWLQNVSRKLETVMPLKYEFASIFFFLRLGSLQSTTVTRDKISLTPLAQCRLLFYLLALRMLVLCKQW